MRSETEKSLSFSSKKKTTGRTEMTARTKTNKTITDSSTIQMITADQKRKTDPKISN